MADRAKRLAALRRAKEAKLRRALGGGESTSMTTEQQNEDGISKVNEQHKQQQEKQDTDERPRKRPKTSEDEEGTEKRDEAAPFVPSQELANAQKVATESTFEAAMQSASHDTEAVDILKINPKKINWDLKQAVEKKVSTC